MKRLFLAITLVGLLLAASIVATQASGATAEHALVRAESADAMLDSGWQLVNSHPASGYVELRRPR